MKRCGERCSAILALILTTALLLLPLWLRGGSRGHDLFHHLLSGHYFALQLWQGELYPRWLMAMNGGFGSPTFFFYPPLPYYVSALFAGADPLPSQAIFPLLWSTSLALLLSGFSAWLWLRSLATPARARLASLLYLALPYHLTMDTYARFALAECWAFVWAPLALLGQDLASQHRRSGPPLLALALALLAFSHLPSLLLTLGLITLRALWLAWQSRRLRPLWLTLAAAGLGLCMASALLLPALADQGAVSMELMSSGMFDFRVNFLDRLPAGWHDWHFRAHLAWQSLLTIVLLLLAWSGAREPHRPALRCWGLIGVGAFLMILPLSEPVWHLLPPLQRVQFPWRCNLILSLATVAVVAMGTPAHRPHQWLWWTLLLVMLASSLAYMLNAPLTQAPGRSAVETEFDAKRSAREYRPQRVPRGAFVSSQLVWQEVFQPSIAADRSGAGWTVRQWRPRLIALEVTARVPTQLVLHQYYYPGWQAWLDDTQALTVSADSHGLLQVGIPAGRHNLTLRLAARWPEQMGNWLSRLGWLIWLGLLYHSRRSESGDRVAAKRPSEQAPG